MSETRTERMYGFIQTALRQQGYPPSFEETLSGPVSRPSRLDVVGQACQLHPRQVLTSLDRLQKLGRLDYRPDRPRSRRLRVESAM